MDQVEATTLAERAARLGLLNADQVRDAWNEMGKRGGDGETFLRIMQRKGHLTPWQCAKLVKDDKEGFFLGGYRLLYKVASGTFGRVFRADDPRTGRIVAIKVLRRKWSDAKHSIDLFEREGRVGMSLSHPNIVQILAVNRDIASQQYYIVMDFVEGNNLRDFLKMRKKLEPAEALRILDDVTSGLVFALSKGITHRDMKLTNILMSTQGAAKLVDFGLAGVYGKSQQREETTLDRTVDYAGLEKVTNVPHGDTRSDIYFLGCVAYEMLTGRPPLERIKNPSERMQKERFLNIEAIKPDEITGPPSVLQLVRTMMSLNPHERFQTPSQVLDALRDVRRDVENYRTPGMKLNTQRTLFLAESDESLQNVLREKLKEKGFRVLLAADPVRALDRFRQQPFDVLIVNAGTTGDNGLFVFDKIMADAERRSVNLGGILMLDEEQAEVIEKHQGKKNLAILVQPVKLKALLQAIDKVLPSDD